MVYSVHMGGWELLVRIPVIQLYNHLLVKLAHQFQGAIFKGP